MGLLEEAARPGPGPQDPGLSVLCTACWQLLCGVPGLGLVLTTVPRSVLGRTLPAHSQAACRM